MGKDEKDEEKKVSNDTSSKPETDSPVKPRYIEYDMSEFWQACEDKYLELAPKGTKLKKVATPFIDEGLRCPTDFGAPGLSGLAVDRTAHLGFCMGELPVPFEQ